MPMLEPDPLGRAFAAESRLEARLQAMTAKAEQEGLVQPARLLQALALSHAARTKRYLMLLRGKIDDSRRNLAGLREEELPGLLAEQAQLMEALQAQGNQPAAKALEQALKVEGQALEHLRQMESGGLVEPAWQVCQVCGYLRPGEPPEHCPVCGAIAQRFTRVQ